VSHVDAIIPALAGELRIARLRAAYGALLHPCQTPEQLLTLSRGTAVELAIVSPVESSGIAMIVAAIRASRRSAPVYIYADRTAASLRAMIPLARAGACGVIVADVDDDVVSLRRLRARGTLARCVDTVTAAVADTVSPRHLPLVLGCLEGVDRAWTALDVARGLSVSRRTLSGWSRSLGARGVRALVVQCRVLVAIEMLRESDRTVEQVAHALSFSSSAHLHNTIKRYTGVRPREALARDVASWCRQLFNRVPLPPAENRLPLEASTRWPNDRILPP
jgi:AraC-like DNA-binding protein